MKIYGIAFVKNGVKFDYPFRESLYSMLPLVEKVYINVGISDDGTLEEIKKIPKVEIIEVDWDNNRTDKGHIFSDMTNIAINAMRKEIQDENAWAIYLQSDEVIHEDDLELIKSDLKKADDSGADVMKFRYMHFWQSNDQVAIGKRWYPEEIRAFKVSSKVMSAGDAQSFSGQTKAFLSDAHIWHYGHVRDKNAYKEKMARFHKYYRSGFKLYRKHIQSTIKSFLFPEKTVTFLGKHPAIMKERIERIDGKLEKKFLNDLHLIGETDRLSPELLKDLNVGKITFNNEAYAKNAKVIDLKKVKWKKSFSPLCREWTPDFQLTIELSRHGISSKN